MKLIVTTPTAIIVDVENVVHIRAEDRTGAFGVEPGHADFITLLPVSVVTWRDADGKESFVLVRGGVFSVHGGELVEIAARGAYREDELSELEGRALEELRKADESEDVADTSDKRMHLATIRQIERVLRSGRSARPAPPLLDRRGEGGDAF